MSTCLRRAVRSSSVPSTLHDRKDPTWLSARNANAHKVAEWLRIIVELSPLKSCLRVF